MLFLKGPWGSGKSFFLRSYLKKDSAFVPSAQYFASVFGLSSLEEVRETINASLDIRPSKDNFVKHAILNGLFGAGKVAKTLKDIPNINGIPVGAISQSVFWHLIRNNKSVVVLDDLERANLPPHNILGLASTFAENSKAKVVIVFNENEIDREHLKKFNQYREKVVDVELFFEPSMDELVKCYLEEKSIEKEIRDAFMMLGITNIRLLLKINTHLRQVNELVGNFGIKLSKEEMVRVAKLICVRYLSKRTLTPQMVMKGIISTSFSKKSENEEDLQLADLTKKLHLYPPSPLDGLAYEVIQNGYCSKEASQKYLGKYTDNKKRDEFNSEFSNAYARYSNNFIASKVEVFADLEAFLNKHAGDYHPNYFFSNIQFLKSIGYLKSTEKWVRDQIRVVSKFDRIEDQMSSAKLMLPSHAAAAFIGRLKANRKPPSDPLSIIKDINKSNTSHPDQWQSLDLMTEHQIYEWIRTCDDDEFISNLREIRKWERKTTGAGPFLDKVDLALKRIAKRSKLDKARVRNLFDLG